MRNAPISNSVNLNDRDAVRELVIQELSSTRPEADLQSIEFLAAGEYTLNYRVSLANRKAVFRIVTGSQMGLSAAEQSLYESHVLKLLSSTSVVPELIDVCPEPEWMPYPYLLLDFLPGRPLNYHHDLASAARCLATIHCLDIPPGHRLQEHLDPVQSILDETDLLLSEASEEYDGSGPDWPGVRDIVRRVRQSQSNERAANWTDHALINTDLNSHNFIVGPEHVWLIDWEKARIGVTQLDLAHFLLPTTTLWRAETATRLTSKMRERFITEYLAARPEIDGQSYRSTLRIALQLAAARAVTWCAWSVQASQRGDRPIQHDETLEKCRLFTSNTFLKSLVDELWGDD